MLISIHYYSPAEFTIAEHDCGWCEPRRSWGSESDIAAVRGDFQRLRENFVSRGIPVVIGEYGVLTEPVDRKDHASNLRWLETVAGSALEIGACPILWDTSVKEMRFLDRMTGRFVDSAVGDMYRRLMEGV
uniref:CAZy families GH5 protein n=1 Tax=uncultured Bifidobacterium sp. TaxID=165187 RepID=A0A060C265_9BIFI|nr:CAZy families GH5 protein [uncultured Bifidobacterium sp.]